MMQDVYMKWNAGLSGKSNSQRDNDSFHQETDLH